MDEMKLWLDATHLPPDLEADEPEAWQRQVSEAHDKLHQGTGLGSEFLAWVDPEAMMPPEERRRIADLAGELRARSDVLVAIGIGGSYLGARAVIEALATPAEAARVKFAGHHLSGRDHRDLLEALNGRRFAINVISKSGTTTEPAIAFRVLRAALEKAAGQDAARQLIVATTDKSSGALRALADREGYRTLAVPDDVGGRYSVLTPVGLLPIAYAGIDIERLVQGAAACANALQVTDVARNPAYHYALARNVLLGKGYDTEILAMFEPRLHMFGEWWRQLFGESEGKDHKGVFPATDDFTTDLHSLGQWIQEGRRAIFETFVIAESGEFDLVIPREQHDLDELNYLAGRTLADVNREAYRATAAAHRAGGVPNMTVGVDRIDALHLGALIYFFEKACGISGYLLGVNPFDQPGVEAYKRNMFALLGKPGYEQDKRVLDRALQASKPRVIRLEGRA